MLDMEISNEKLETIFLEWRKTIKKPNGSVPSFEAFKEGFRQGTLLLKDGETVQVTMSVGVKTIKRWLGNDATKEDFETFCRDAVLNALFQNQFKPENYDLETTNTDRP